MKFWLLLAVPLACTAFGQELRISVPYTHFRLPNGLDVIMHVDSTTPTVSVNTYYHVGSANERPGRTGFAHLFEHLMFEGSGHVPEGKFDDWLESAGGDNNGSTNNDRTNYYEDVPSNALELPLYLDSDRMGFLLDAMTQQKLDAQRAVVKNERRQSYENRPYGMAEIEISKLLYPPDYPYHWPTIGSMEDLNAASFEDVANFFRTYYVPNNASLVIAGDIDTVKTRALVERWFGDIPAGKPVPPIDVTVPALTGEKRQVMEDAVQLPRLYMTWITPAIFTPGDATLDVVAGILATGKSSRLYKKLVYDLQIAQNVMASQSSGALNSEFSIVVTARAGHDLNEIERAVEEELDRIRREAPAQREVERIVNRFEAHFLDRLEKIGGFGGVADQLNNYFVRTGNPDYFNEDLARYRGVDPDGVRAIARKYLRDDARVVLSVVPKGKRELAATGKGGK